MGMDRGSARPTKLTARKVETARPVKNDKGELVRTEIPDPGKPGLFLIVQPGGRKSWAVRYRRPGDRVPRKVTLDGFPSLALAHKLAQQALDRVADGGDPAAEKQAERARRAEREHNSDLVEGMFHDFLVKHVRRKNGRPIRETTRRETARLLGFKRDPKNPDGWIKTGSGVLARWRGRTVQSITKRNVLDLLDELVEVAPVAANRTLAALKTCFSWRVNRDSETLPKSPCDGVDDPSAEAERERVLTDAELAALWRAADADGYPFGRMVQMLVLTGCRRDEVREASWAEVDLPGRKWAIPGHRTKNGHDHLLPLSDAAMAVLESLPRIKGKAGLMFSTTGVTAISGLARAKRRLHEAMTRELGEEPERWVLHDTRRSFLTGLQRLKFPLEVAEACVNHRSGTLSGVTKVYARHDYADEKKVAFDAWARHVEAIVSGEPAKIIAMRRGA